MHGSDAPCISIQTGSRATNNASDSTSSSYPGDWSSRRKKVLKRDEHICQSCGAHVEQDGTNAEVHHSTYLKEGGSNDLENLLTLCTSCHKRLHSSPVKASQAVTDSSENSRSTGASSSDHSPSSQETPKVDAPPVNSPSADKRTQSSKKPRSLNRNTSSHRQTKSKNNSKHPHQKRDHNSKTPATAATSTAQQIDRETVENEHDLGFSSIFLGGIVLSLVLWGTLEVLLMVLSSMTTWSATRFILVLGIVETAVIVGYLNEGT
ncbi:HNH endonuclease [Natrarchaeobius chitinivorans]